MNSFRFFTMDGVPCGDHEGLKLAMSEGPCKVTVEDWSDAKEISYQQIRWWKGVLLPALARDGGESETYYETALKLEVMPDEFQPVTTVINNIAFNTIPSITTLSMKKLNQLIEGSVQKCHEWGFTWVTLPDSSLRST